MELLTDRTALHWLEVNALAAGLTDSWGKRYFATEQDFLTRLAATAHVVYMRDAKGVLIAFARMTDDGANCMIYDVMVAVAQQSMGLGRRLIEYFIDLVKDKNYISIGLFCEENTTVEKFYSKLGFERANGMELTKYQRTEWP